MDDTSWSVLVSSEVVIGIVGFGGETAGKEEAVEVSGTERSGAAGESDTGPVPLVAIAVDGKTVRGATDANLAMPKRHLSSYLPRKAHYVISDL